MTTRLASVLLGMIALAAIAVLVPHAFAQVEYTPADNPVGPMQMIGWAAGIGAMAVMSGVGVYSAVKRS